MNQKKTADRYVTVEYWLRFIAIREVEEEKRGDVIVCEAKYR